MRLLFLVTTIFLKVALWSQPANNIFYLRNDYFIINGDSVATSNGSVHDIKIQRFNKLLNEKPKKIKVKQIGMLEYFYRQQGIMIDATIKMNIPIDISFYFIKDSYNDYNNFEKFEGEVVIDGFKINRDTRVIDLLNSPLKEKLMESDNNIFRMKDYSASFLFVSSEPQSKIKSMDIALSKYMK